MKSKMLWLSNDKTLCARGIGDLSPTATDDVVCVIFAAVFKWDNGAAIEITTAFW